jgi:hypothetical protein
VSVAQRQSVSPVARALAAGRFGGRIAFEVIRDFVWADLREGVLDLRGLGAPLRALVWLGFGLMLLVIAAIMQGDLWRQTFPLVPLTQGIPGRGRLVPTAVIPATFFLLSLAWSFVLAGALRARPLIRFGVLAIWALNTVGAMASGGTSGVLGFAASIGTLLAVPATFAVFAFMPPRRVLEMLVMLVLVTANNATNQLQGVETWQTSGLPTMVVRLNFELLGLTMMIMPLLLLVGMDVAGFTVRAAGWVTSIVEERLPAWVPAALLVVLLGWRLWETGQEAAGWIADGPLDLQMAALGGGMLVLVLVGLAWGAVRVVSKRAPGRPVDAAAVASADEPGNLTADEESVEETAGRLVLPVVLAYTATLAIVVVLSGVALAITVLTLLVPAVVPISEAMVKVIALVGGDNAQWVWHLIVSAGALVAAFVFARRGRPTGALFLAILGLLDLKSRLSAAGRPLDVLTAAGPGNRADIWWVLLFAGVALWWLARRELTPARAGALAFLTLVTLLLRQTDFVSNRFSPFVGGGGLGFLAFGIVWDALTIGAWANEGSVGLPRVSRIFLYLGYVLMTVTVINWAVASHDLGEVGRLTGELGLVGLEAFGKPMLYTIFALTLATAGRRPDSTSERDAAEPALLTDG